MWGGSGYTQGVTGVKGNTGVLDDARAEVQGALDVPRGTGNKDAGGVWVP